MKNPHSKTTLQKIAACEALGLSYWSDHPATRCVWAVDESQQPHVVRWCPKEGTAAIAEVSEYPTTVGAYLYPRGRDRVIRDREGNYLKLVPSDVSDRVRFAA